MSACNRMLGLFWSVQYQRLWCGPQQSRCLVQDAWTCRLTVTQLQSYTPPLLHQSRHQHTHPRAGVSTTRCSAVEKQPLAKGSARTFPPPHAHANSSHNNGPCNDNPCHSYHQLYNKWNEACLHGCLLQPTKPAMNESMPARHVGPAVQPLPSVFAKPCACTTLGWQR